jgi:hypothetical protein
LLTTHTSSAHRYGIAQKEQMGFDKAVEECSATTRRSNHTNARTHSRTHTLTLGLRVAVRRVPNVALRRLAQQ